MMWEFQWQVLPQGDLRYIHLLLHHPLRNHILNRSKFVCPSICLSVFSSVFNLQSANFAEILRNCATSISTTRPSSPRRTLLKMIPIGSPFDHFAYNTFFAFWMCGVWQIIYWWSVFSLAFNWMSSIIRVLFFWFSKRLRDVSIAVNYP